MVTIFDVAKMFLFLYVGACVGGYARRYGPTYGIVGAIGGFVTGFLLWYFATWCILRTGKKPNNKER